MLPRESAYAVGNRVYRHGSSAPTRGTVDPTGYVDRERRSGLAAAALRRVESQRNTMSTASRTPTPVAKPKPIQKAPLPPPKPKPPVVTHTGALKPIPKPASPKALPYDPEAFDEQIDANSQYMNILNTLMGKEQEVNRNYTTATRDAQVAEPEKLKGLLNNFASRGMAFSSGYGTAYSGEQNNFARTLSDIAQARTSGLNDINNQRTSAKATLAQTLAAIQRQAARRLSTKAGDLGLK